MERPHGERRRALRPQRPLRVRAASSQPRIGVAYLLQATNTVFRASYNRMFITPEYENILISSSAQAAIDHASRHPGQPATRRRPALQSLRTARRVQRRLPAGDRLETAVRRLALVPRVKNAADQDQFFNTGIVFPLNFESGDFLQGWNAAPRPRAGSRRASRLRVGRTRRGAVLQPVRRRALPRRRMPSTRSAAAASSSTTTRTSRSRSGSSTTSGRSGVWAGMTQRYDSGLVTDAGRSADVLSSPDTAYAAPYIRFRRGPAARKLAHGLELLARSAPPEIRHSRSSCRLDLLNAFDEKGLYNFQSDFGGTHVIPPRTFAGRVKFVF